MATKDSYMSAQDGHQSSYGNNLSSINNPQYNNLNLNATNQFPSVNPVHSESISTEFRSGDSGNNALTKVPDHIVGNNYQNERRNDSNTLTTKPNPGLYPDPLKYLNESKENERDDKHKESGTNQADSNLSLHISAYENSIEKGNQDVQDNSGESDEKKPKKGKWGKAFKNVKNLIFTGSTSKEASSSDSNSSAPETMRFKSSQKLLDVKKSKTSIFPLKRNVSNSTNKDTITEQRAILPSVFSGFQNLLPGLNLSQENVILLPAFGQAITQGELYDARNGTFCGRSLFLKSLDSHAKTKELREIASECILGNSLNAQFKKLGIDGDVKLSVLSGMIKIDDKYLPSDFFNGEAAASLITQITTKLEVIDVDSRAVIKQLSSHALENCGSATHVLIGIQKGIRATISLTSLCQDGNAREIVENDLQLALRQFEANVKDGNDEFDKSAMIPNTKFSFHFDGNTSVDNGIFPHTLQEAASFMIGLPNMVNGKEIPLSYILLPITYLKQTFKKLDLSARIVYNADEISIKAVVGVFDELGKTLKLVTSMRNNFIEHMYCLKNEVVQSISSKVEEITDLKKELQNQLNVALMEVRSGQKPSSAVMDVVQSYYKSSISPQTIMSYYEQLHPYELKTRYVQMLAQNGVICVGRNNSMEAERLKCGLKDCYEYYCDWSNALNLAENSKVFLEFVNYGQKMVFVDSEVNPHARNINEVPDGNRICQRLNGRYIDLDCLQTWKQEQTKCFVKCMGPRQEFETNPIEPIEHVNVELPCPQSFHQGCCSDAKREWYCAKCEQRLQYDFKHNFYCHCGIAPVGLYHFCCSDQNHGGSYVGFDEDKLLTLVDEILPTKKINILLLGETGVGKSTWINSFANYLTSSTLAEAEKAKPICLIPSQFTTSELVNGQWEEKTISIGESENESFQTGESCTQHPQCHSFTVGDKTIRIIDTPGIGDPRGTETDDENFASILKYISQFDEIHGICILLKPNNSKLTMVFKYCISGLLAKLHQSAAKNIAFCFTRIHESLYRPGDTLPVLKRYVKELRDITIAINDKTIYGLDNEAFRFLHLLNNGVTFTDDERKGFDKSWDMSVKETQRLLNHFVNEVEPHVVGETMSLNEARKIILTAAKPLADITKNIQQNIKAINRQRNEIEQANAYELVLRGKLMIKHIGIKTEPLEKPRTVCNAASCTETKRLPNSEANKVIYKKICHDKCRVPDVTPEIAPNPALQNCLAMDENLKCTECGCSWDTHLHITFNQEEVEEEVEDENVRRSINQNKSAKEVQQDAIKALKQRLDEYKKAQADIDRILAKFASFLKKNAILAYNDTIEDYLKLNIREEKEQRNPNQELLRKMEEQLKQYREEKRILDSRLTSGQVQHVQPNEIKALQKELENLPLVGKDFKMLFDAHINGIAANLQLGEQHYDPYFHTNNQARRPKNANIAASNGSTGEQQGGIFQTAKAIFNTSWNFLYPQN